MDLWTTMGEIGKTEISDVYVSKNVTQTNQSIVNVVNCEMQSVT